MGPEPTQRFGDRAQAYARARPRYPAAAIEALARALGLAPGATVVDLGCGTGLSSEAFLAAGFDVIGVEPNAPMRAQAAPLAQRHAGAPRFTLADGRAEATGLAAACADLVVAAQAFHWFEVPAARAEALRILRPPARAALLWNDRRGEGSAFAEGYERLLRAYGEDYLEVRHRHGRDDRVGAFFGHAGWRTIVQEHQDALDWDGLCARLQSASYMPAPGSARHAPMLAALRELFDATSSAGRVVMSFDTRILYGSMHPDAP